ncbi:MAG: M28 family peptidase [Promethearchaeota archaeon]|jgi:hypothetical protein
MIKEAQIKKHLKEFSFPRLTGTEFELKAFNKVKQEVEKLGLEHEVQNFTFSTFYSRLYPKIAFSLGSLILFLFYLYRYMIISWIFTFILVGIIAVSFVLTRKPEKIQIIPKLNSQNLLVKINSKSNEKKNDDRILMFISHLDSKGQRFKIQIRIRIIKLWIWSAIILAAIIILKIIMLLRFEMIFFIVGLNPLIPNVIASILLIFNTTDNSSDGAVDNASGIACNLELLNYYADPLNRLTKYNMWFLFTGAEECGTMGARHFLNNLEWLDVDTSIIFNFESITQTIFLFPGGREKKHVLDVNNLLLNNKRGLILRHHPTNRILGTHSDGGFLADHGLQGYGIGGVEAHAYMHTKHDTLDKVNTDVLSKLCLVLIDSLKEHDSNFFK